MSNAVLERIDVDRIVPHPKNPRIAVREDVVDAIAAQVSESGFSSVHAILVRPVGTDYEIISGHHRVLAARKCGLRNIPCWVQDMTDEEALMGLALSNAQGELDPLELGIHVYRCVPLAKGGRGQTAGLREYARAVGKDDGYVTRLRSAGEVANTAALTQQFLGKAMHLSEIHATDPALWPMLCEKMIEAGWSVADTKHWVDKIREFNPPEKWMEIFLPLVPIAQRFLDTLEFSPRTVSQLAGYADSTEAMIRANAAPDAADAIVANYHEWLKENSGGESWKVPAMVKKYREIELSFVTPTHSTNWYLGDWRDHVDKLSDGIASLLLTDPPYGINFQSDYRLDRSKPRKHDTIANDDTLDECMEAIETLLPKLREDAHILCFCQWKTEPELRRGLESIGLSVRGSLIWAKNNTGMGDVKTTFAPKHERIIHAVKGSPMLYEREADVLAFSRVSSESHPTQKPVDLLARLIEVTTVHGDVVLDPFGGVASTVVAAIGIGRNYWACELKEEFYKVGSDRISNA